MIDLGDFHVSGILDFFLSTEAHTSNMFENLSERLSQSLRQVSGQARLSEDNIKDAPVSYTHLTLPTILLV